MERSSIRQISGWLWEIPRSYRSDMRVPARFYASEAMLDQILADRSLEQLVNVAALPGIVGFALAMPDIHEGYGFPIGGVAAFDLDLGVISPGGIGYDINCGVRLLATNETFESVREKIPDLAKEIYRQAPSGVGHGNRITFSSAQIDSVLRGGAPRMVELGYGEPEDLGHIESGGVLDVADPSKVSQQAKQRGHDQLGTLGAGNHFVEIDRIDAIYDRDAAGRMGLFEGQIVIQLHTGSRGLGHQIATDSIRIMNRAMPAYGIIVPDRELCCAPFRSPEGQEYFSAMSAGANFAWANRQLITWEIRQAWKSVMAGDPLRVVYDVAHNIAKVETHEIDGQRRQLLVHRKGATRAFVGQPVIIPGSMGTASFVLEGQAASMRESFGSSCHGAGRRMSRTKAKQMVQGSQLRRELEAMGVSVQAGSMQSLAEEAPAAYKDIGEVVGAVVSAGIARKVARLVPVGVMKG
ncbi:RtcB family protein [Chlorobaculum thiosulfatiphilum]|uniref:tRNA-splicing ligase RtcB n=1 Tax=Chlorobaculum thiosulfatiphilum TaxID=115852 RepID=A0A5C4S7W0_CHLTI|nr:RtcB family protein [Chlorobaculum thiosulfatiphilum]